MRHVGRRQGCRVVSYPLLIKGLEFDQVVVLGASSLETREQLYVALTRPRSALTVFSASPALTHLSSGSDLRAV
jgi:DNA helicase IV